jgi:tRNA modification GTPase
MSDSHRDTIFALSSGRGPAAIAVVRVSGPRASDALTALGVKIPAPRKASLARIRDPQTNEIIDEGLALWFPGPRSETGEDVVELQLHGGHAVIAATLRALGRIKGLRPAEAGEFTRRAFENGKLDLTAVEGLADLVSAETEGQRRQAFRQMKGALGGRAERWRAQLIQALALVEARIDFSDEADVPEDLVAPALAIARALEAEIAATLADGGRGERLREGLVVAIAGPPNAGKSTLLNRLARREAAIVSPYAGTTRDVIEVHLDLGGLPVTLLDTAGIRETDDPVELEGVRRARDRAAAADLVLWVVDASEGVGDGEGLGGVTEFAAPRPPVWLVRNKIDLVDQGLTGNDCSGSTACKNEEKEQVYNPLKITVNQGLTARNEAKKQSNVALKNVGKSRLTNRSELVFGNREHWFNISAASGDGFDGLLAALSAHAEHFLAGAESALVTRERHRRALEDTLAALRRALAGDLAGREDLLAEELRIAAAALGRLTGRVDVEDILEVIFRDFCIGK